MSILENPNLQKAIEKALALGALADIAIALNVLPNIDLNV